MLPAYHLDVSKIASSVNRQAGSVNYAGTHETPVTRVRPWWISMGQWITGKLAELRRDHPERFNMASIGHAIESDAIGHRCRPGLAVDPC